jgi:hypothetical protein
LRHQAVVVVIEHVTVDHELAEVVAELAGDEDSLARVDEEGVLEAVFPGRRLAVAGEQVPVGAPARSCGDVDPRPRPSGR